MRLKDLLHISKLPRVSINLMLSKAENNAFYAKVVENFYAECQTHHKTYRLRNNRFGFTVCYLFQTFDDYLKKLPGSARRNYKKAIKTGLTTKRIDSNQHLEDIRAIWQSTNVRQGELPDYMKKGEVQAHQNPVSKNHYHDYPYFAVVKDNTVIAFASCLIAGELCLITDIYGHKNFLQQGVVPMLIIDMFKDVIQSYPEVKYYCYGNYYGAGSTMRRFKRKFLFHPHRVTWLLDAPESQQEMLVYLCDTNQKNPSLKEKPDDYLYLNGTAQCCKQFAALMRTFGFIGALKACLKTTSRKRFLFGICDGKRFVQYGWVNIDFCKFYQIEDNGVVFGSLWTDENQRGKGLASKAISHTMYLLSKQGYSQFYIDCTTDNIPSQKMIKKSGFTLIHKIRQYTNL